MLKKIRKILVVIMSIMAAVFIALWFRWVSMGMLDIDQIIKYGIVATVCSIWLLLFTYANLGDEANGTDI